MKQHILSLSIVACTLVHSAGSFAQCNAGEVEVTMEVSTDNYGYEIYFELLPGGNSCGNGTIFAGGNSAVGCNGAGAQAQTPGGYGNNGTFNEGPWCLTEGAQYDVFWADDWGDGGGSIEIFIDGVSIGGFAATGIGLTYTFTAEGPPARDMSVTKITSPIYVYENQQVAIAGKIKNLGADPVTSFDLNYTIDGGAPITSTINGVNLVAGDVYDFQHATPWVPIATGTFDLEVWAGNINGGADLVPANDMLSKQLVVNLPIPNIIDDYLVAPPSVVSVATSNQDLLVPRDLDFHPDLARNELWTVLKGTENSGGSTVTFNETGEPNMTWLWKKDANSWHFMSLPTGMAMSDNGNWANSPGVFDANHNGGTPFTGPALWSSDMSVYAEPSGGNGSHLDMLHVNPECQGIAHESGNRFWVVDGYNGDIVMNDFVDDHGPGNDFHGDAIIHRYAEFTITKDPNDHIVSHTVLDKSTGWLYVVDHGADRIMRLDINSGTIAGNPSFGPFETYAEYKMVTGYTYEEIINTGLVEPAGIEVIGDRLLVSDHSNGDIIIYDVNDPNWNEMGRIITNSPGIMGIKVGPDGKIWAVNASNHSLIRIDPSPLAGISDMLNDPVWSIQPVPASTMISISGELPHGQSQLQIIDAAGRLALHSTVSQTQRSFNVEQLGAGTYQVRVVANNGEVSHQRLLIAR